MASHNLCFWKVFPFIKTWWKHRTKEISVYSERVKHFKSKELLYSTNTFAFPLCVLRTVQGFYKVKIKKESVVMM